MTCPHAVKRIVLNRIDARGAPSIHAPCASLPPLPSWRRLLSALAMLLRSLRRRSKAILGSSSASAAAAPVVTRARVLDRVVVEEVRKRLSGVQARRGLFGTVWDETVRAIWDTVAMGGRGPL